MRNALIATLLITACASVPNPQSNKLSDEPIKGAVFLGNTIEGNCLFKPFVKMEDTTNDPDTNEAQILGYSPGNVVITKDGKGIVLERVLAKDFHILRGVIASKRGPCRVPDYVE